MECPAGHKFHRKYLKKPEGSKITVSEKRKSLASFYRADKDKVKLLSEADDNIIETLYQECDVRDYWDDNGNIKESWCPVCSLRMLTLSEIMDYLLFEAVGKKGEPGKILFMENKIRPIFPSYKDFASFLRGVK
jgi:hypothetical protein